MKVALVAHDAKKADVVQLARKHLDLLSQMELVTTGTTALLVAGVGLDVERVNSGPAGGCEHLGNPRTTTAVRSWLKEEIR